MFPKLQVQIASHACTVFYKLQLMHVYQRAAHHLQFMQQLVSFTFAIATRLTRRASGLMQEICGQCIQSFKNLNQGEHPCTAPPEHSLFNVWLKAFVLNFT